jgi:HSP20 family protein
MNQLSVRRSDPFSSLVDDVFNDFFQRSGAAPGRSPDAPSVARARMDVLDKGDTFEITVDLPGVSKEDINVTVEGARVTLQAESRKQRETKDGERVLHSERTVTSYARSFELPVEVSEDGADASFENGVLTLALPKRVAVTSKRLAVR